jgi:hypothetical protein
MIGTSLSSVRYVFFSIGQHVCKYSKRSGKIISRGILLCQNIAQKSESGQPERLRFPARVGESDIAPGLSFNHQDDVEPIRSRPICLLEGDMSSIRPWLKFAPVYCNLYLTGLGEAAFRRCHRNPLLITVSLPEYLSLATMTQGDGLRICRERIRKDEVQSGHYYLQHWCLPRRWHDRHQGRRAALLCSLYWLIDEAEGQQATNHQQQQEGNREGVGERAF